MVHLLPALLLLMLQGPAALERASLDPRAADARVLAVLDLLQGQTPAMQERGSRAVLDEMLARGADVRLAQLLASLWSDVPPPASLTTTPTVVEIEQERWPDPVAKLEHDPALPGSRSRDGPRA